MDGIYLGRVQWAESKLRMKPRGTVSFHNELVEDVTFAKEDEKGHTVLESSQETLVLWGQEKEKLQEERRGTPHQYHR